MEDHIPHTDSYFLRSREIIKTNGDEYKRASEIKKLSLQLIVPINFPTLKISNDSITEAQKYIISSITFMLYIRKIIYG